MEQNLNHPPMLSGPGPRRTPQNIVEGIANYIKAGIVLVGWMVVAAFVLSAAYVALRGMGYAVHLVLNAMGI